MRKILTVLLATACVLGAQANEIATLAARSANSMTDVATMLEQTQAFIFLSKGEERNMHDIVDRSGSLKASIFGNENATADWSEFTWTLSNPDIAEIDVTPSGAVLLGKAFGETFLTITDTRDGSEYYFVILCSPMITVISPEGVVLRYPKMYEQPARINITQSRDYVINCVMVKGFGNGYSWEDITNKVNRGKDPDDDDDLDANLENGYFESKETITDNLVFVITHESSEHHADGDNVVGKSGINLQLAGKDLTVVDNRGETSTRLANAKFTYTNVQKTSKEGTLDQDGKFTFPEEGIFFIEFDSSEIKGTFKIFVVDLASLDTNE